MSTQNTPVPANAHFISLGQAISMTVNYRTNREEILTPSYQGQDILPLSETFNLAAFQQLVATPGCAGLRIYYGMDESLKVHALVVAVNSLNEDILPPSANVPASSDSDDVVIVEEGQRCPPLCAADSPLNS